MPYLTGNLPNWPGASHCYSKAYMLLADMAAKGHVTPSSGKAGRRGFVPCSVSSDMNYLIDALNVGDEEAIKGFLLLHPRG